MFFQTPTPDTSGYMIAGFVVSFVVMGLYVVSLYLRNRNLNQDKAMLEEMDRQASQPAPGKKQQSKPKGAGKKSKK